MSDDVSSATLLEFNPAGNLDGLTLENRKLWSSQFINYWMQGEIDAKPNVVSNGRNPLTQDFNGTLAPFRYHVETSSCHLECLSKNSTNPDIWKVSSS